MAANTDKLRKTKSLSSTTLGVGGLTDGGTSCLFSSPVDWPTDTAITIMVDRRDADGNPTLDKVEEITGVLNADGVTFESLLRGRSDTTPQAHLAGATVELTMAGSMWNDLIDAILAEHNQDGSHKENMLELVYPVGSVYMNASVATNPGTLLGFGTWEAMAEGQVLVGVDATDPDFEEAGLTGGEKDHTLTEAELAAHDHAATGLTTNSTGSHTHSFSATTNTTGNHRHKMYVNAALRVFSDSSTSGAFIPEAVTGYGQRDNYMTTEGNHSHTVSGTTGSGGSHSHTISGDTADAGSGQAHNNLQPFLTVHMWKRTA